MITNGNERMSVGGGFLSVEEFYGLSTDTKPTNTANGSTFFEMDTGKMYRFNFSGTTWTETTHYGGDGFGPAPSGGGGDTPSGGGVLVVHADADTGALDKTWQEIYDAIANGQIPVIYEVGDDNSTLYYVASTNDLSLFGDGYVVQAMTVAGSAFSFNEWAAGSASGYPMPNE